MASDDCDFDLSVITEEELNTVELGNEQTWLYCAVGSDPNDRLDIDGYLSAHRQPPQLSLNVSSGHQNSQQSGGIDTGTYTRPKKMTFKLGDCEAQKREYSISSQPGGDVASRLSFLSSHSPLKTSSLKDVTNSSYSPSKRLTMLRLANFDDYSDSILQQTMLSDLCAPTFSSISDSDDGMSENHPNIPSTTIKRYDNRTRRINPADIKLSQDQSPFTASSAVSSTPKVLRRRPVRTSISDLSFVKPNSTVVLEQNEDISPISSIPGTPKSCSKSPHMADTSCDAMNGTFALLEESSSDRRSYSCFSPRTNGIRHSSTSNLSQKNEPQHFKSVESGLNDTFKQPDSFSEVTNNMASFIVENPYSPSSINSLQRSLGDVHLAAQQQEYELRDSVASMPTVSEPTLKSSLMKVLSENCLFSSDGDRKLRIAPNHHSSVSNLSLDVKDNNNRLTGVPMPQIPVAGPRRSGLPVSIRGAGAKTRSRLPTRLPRFQAAQPKSNSDWTDGCY